MDKLAVINTALILLSFYCVFRLSRRTPIYIDRKIDQDTPGNYRERAVNHRAKIINTPTGEYILETSKNRIKVNDDEAAYLAEQDAKHRR